MRAIVDSRIEPELVSVDDAAFVLGVSRRQVEIFARDGTLTPVRPPGLRRVLFVVRELRELALTWAGARGTTHASGPSAPSAVPRGHA